VIEDVDDGETHGLNRSLTVTLPESLPHLVGGAALEVDDFIGLFVTDASFTGAWLDLLSFAYYSVTRSPGPAARPQP
jgi:hypothetical protein